MRGCWRILTLGLVALVMSSPADSASRARRCRKVYAAEIGTCVASGVPRRLCRKDALRRCKTDGPQVPSALE